jgi:hypothetical protein
MHAQARTEGVDFNLAHIPSDFSALRQAPFDQAYMRVLYERGLALGRTGYPWEKAPPGAETGRASTSAQ